MGTSAGTPLVGLLRAAADLLERLGEATLGRDMRLQAMIERAADAECDRLGLPRGVWWRASGKENADGVAIRVAAMRAARDAGQPVSAIARALGVHATTVRYHLSK